MRSCERPRKRSLSEALPSSVSKRYSLSIRTHGSSCRRRASSSLRCVSSFSALSSSSRAASHWSRVPVLCVVIALLLSFLLSVATLRTSLETGRALLARTLLAVARAPWRRRCASSQRWTLTWDRERFPPPLLHSVQDTSLSAIFMSFSSCSRRCSRVRRGDRPFLARFRLCVALSECGFSSVGHLDPLRVRRGLGVIVVVPVPPLVRRGLRVTLRRVLPSLLTAERRDIEVAPGAPHRLVAAAVDEISAEHSVAIADECIVAVPLVHAEVAVEAVPDGVPRDLPAHARLQARDVRLRRARGVRERGIARVQMGQMCDLVGQEGA